MSYLTIFDNKVEENGLKYYIIPQNYPLFKAKKITNNKEVYIELLDGHAYFFGIKDLNDEYLRSYEQLYGVIFEYKTKSQIKLLALDDKQTQKNLYNNAPKEIKDILENNYGYYNNIRNSVPEPDKTLGRYLCSTGNQGYGIFKMKTDLGGIFHPELLICNATNFVELVGQITPNNRIDSIIEASKLDELKKEMEKKRKVKGKYSSNYSDIPKLRLFGDDDDDPDYLPRTKLFGDDDNPDYLPRTKLFRDDDKIGGKKQTIKKITRKKITRRKITRKKITRRKKRSKNIKK